MKLYSLLLVCAFLSLNAYAQTTSAIKFENNLTWSQIRQKAKAENKFIFLDAYTTWCGPCKQMSREVFPMKEVGDFFNKHFISVAIQFDVSDKDDENTKKWRNDAEQIKSLYRIAAYPTYLFLAADGELRHTIVGAILNPEEFIAKASEALDPKSNLQGRKTEFLNGNRSEAFLLSLINAANAARDPQLPEYVNAYLLTQSLSKRTEETFKVAALGITDLDDMAFKLIANHPESASKALGKHARAEVLAPVIFENEIFPLLRKNGKVRKNGAYTVGYEGEINQTVDWIALKRNLSRKYGDLGTFLYTDARAHYFMWTNDWPGFNQTMINYTENRKDISLDYVLKMLGYLTVYTDDQASLLGSLAWAKVLETEKGNAFNKKMYSYLLYQADKHAEAIVLMEAYVNTKDVFDQNAIDNIPKMKKGEKIYL